MCESSASLPPTGAVSRLAALTKAGGCPAPGPSASRSLHTGAVSIFLPPAARHPRQTRQERPAAHTSIVRNGDQGDLKSGEGVREAPGTGLGGDEHAGVDLDADYVQWQEDLVLLGPFNAQGGELIDPLAYTLDDASVVDVKSVRLLPGMIPGDAHAFLTLTHRPTSREYTVTGDVYPFCHAGCFAIFAAVLSKSPRALSYPERVLWAVIRKRNLGARNASAVAGVHYGAELERTRRKRAVAPLANIQQTVPDPAPAYLPARVLNSLANNAYDRATIRDWWLGRGAMWIFSRPDRFPLRQAFGDNSLPAPVAGASYFDRLPFELVAKIGKLLAFSDFVSFLLAGALDPEEVRARVPDWMQPPPAAIGAVETAQGAPVPWLQYARHCLASSASMRNRQRIFGVAHQLLRVAEEMTDAELGQ
ncbi:hypothetical protein AURDEDRAFT_155145 [Auricularia subglabra TFB-10046 SS5]|uniref:Uncharacterized protein n=1 Tax=Auricularia subglabra (strain TFB-10046 / SS5) TaxID=717982 RepID=J0D1I1_AURST|nr:hypothetical protein AURDEDRAFT_155145 [Auricularia subglabra TFB-10046 SS5]